MRPFVLTLSAFLLIAQPLRMSPEDRAKSFLIGTYLGDEMQPDGTNGTGTTMHHTYYVRTEDGTWSLVSYSDAADVLAHRVGITPVHFRAEHPILFDNLKHGEKFAFRAEPDRRLGATKTSYHVYVPRADDPKKEDKFDAEFMPSGPREPEPTDNVRAMCAAHRFSPEQEKQYCGNE